MSMIYVKFRLEHPIFRETLRQVPAVELRWLRNAPNEARSNLLVWATIDDLDAFRRAVAADPTIDEIVRIIDVEDRHLCQVELSDSGTGSDLYPILLETGSVVRDATVTADGWDCHFGFADRSALSRFFDTAREQDYDYEIERVYESRQGGETDDGLTDAQREALVTALEFGYFDVPRRNGLERVADELDISDSAVSERLRRGTRSLITSAVATDVDVDGAE